MTDHLVYPAGKQAGTFEVQLFGIRQRFFSESDPLVNYFTFFH